MTGKQQIYAVILTYNHYEDTHECLQSLLEAAGAEIRIVLVDNGSSDGTPPGYGRIFRRCTSWKMAKTWASRRVTMSVSLTPWKRAPITFNAQ